MNEEETRRALAPKKKWASEAEVAAQVVAYLRDMGWRVWQEVGLAPYAHPSFDIVAELDGKLWSIETKTGFAHQVVAQAWARRKYVHWASVATPPVVRITSASQLSEYTASHLGIGRIVVYGDDYVFQETPPMMLRRPEPKALASLREQLERTPENFATAGTNVGGRWSPFRETCDKIRRFVHAHPGATLAEVISGVDHHYRKDSTAHASISKWARLGKIRGVEVRKDGRLFRLYAQESAS